jgi:hypothetical protein
MNQLRSAPSRAGILIPLRYGVISETAPTFYRPPSNILPYRFPMHLGEVLHQGTRKGSYDS